MVKFSVMAVRHVKSDLDTVFMDQEPGPIPLVGMDHTTVDKPFLNTLAACPLEQLMNLKQVQKIL